MSAVGPMRAAKMEALARCIARRDGTMRLTADAYKVLADRGGLSRSDVARAVDDLFECGRAGVDGSDGSIVVELMDSPT